MSFLLRLLINAAALWAATRLVPGVTFTGTWMSMAGVALVFGLVNAVIRPVVKLLSLPLVLLTLGLFSLVVNGCMLWLTSALSGAFDLGFSVDGFRAALPGAIVVSIVSWLLSLLARDDHMKERS